jgi:hypothetical protein
MQPEREPPDLAKDGQDRPKEPSTGKEKWVKPEIISFKPVTAAQGISYLPLDGISNLTP